MPVLEGEALEADSSFLSMSIVWVLLLDWKEIHAGGAWEDLDLALLAWDRN